MTTTQTPTINSVWFETRDASQVAQARTYAIELGLGLVIETKRGLFSTRYMIKLSTSNKDPKSLQQVALRNIADQIARLA